MISDTHSGAWTGEDLLRHDHDLALLAPHLDDVDEVIFLGDLFDFLLPRCTTRSPRPVQIELRYPTYRFGGVLCTHGHYLDYHAHRHGSLPNRLVGWAL